MTLKTPINLYFYLSVSLFFHNAIFAQGENNIWYIRNFVIDFNSGSPEIILTPPVYFQSSSPSAISDNNGNLLFYSSGETVRDRNHQLLPNGQTLQGRGFSQPTLFVLDPANPDLYYLFTLGLSYMTREVELRYVIIDRTQNNGNGDIISGQYFLRGNLTAMMAAARGECGSIWVLVHEYNSNRFLAYELTEKGVADPVISEAGSIFTENPTAPGRNGKIRVAPNSEKLATFNYRGTTIELFDFNKITGKVSNSISLPIETNTFTTLSGSFSSDNTKFYTAEDELEDLSRIYQFDLSSEAPQEIINSKTLIKKAVGDLIDGVTDMQLGPDSVIYITSSRAYLSAIPYPNRLGTACGFIDTLLLVPSNHPSAYFETALQNLVVTPSPPTITSSQLLPQDTQLCNSQSLLLDVSIPDHQYLWQDSSTNAQYTISTPGTYWVNVRKGNCTLTDTLVVLPDHSDFELGVDTTLCTEQTLELSLEDKPELAFLWNDGSTSPHFSIKQSGTYLLQTIHGLCSHSDSINVLFENIPPALPKDTILCAGDSLSIDLSHFKGNIQWQDGSTNPKTTIKQPGLYSVLLTTNHCSKTDSFNLDFANVTVQLPNDTLICSGESLLIDLSHLDGKFNWNDGSSSDQLLVQQPGLYHVRYTQHNCSDADTMQVFFDSLSVNLGKDTALCPNQSITLQVNPASGLSFQWQDGSSDSIYIIDQAGSYWVEIQDNLCKSRDSIEVQIVDLSINLGLDQTVCEGATILLDASLPNTDYLWQDGTDLPTFLATESGTYWVEVTRNNCTASDTIQLTFSSLSVDLGKDTSLCEGESILLSVPEIYDAYEWQNGSTSNELEANNSGVYWIKVQQENCFANDSITIRTISCEAESPCQLYVPNVFSPNNDGTNDTFQPFSNCDLENYRLEIYDRWGNRLFITEDIQQAWNGMFNNEQLDVGVYIVKTIYKLPERRRPDIEFHTLTIVR